jgi:hypothetical protein
MTDTNVEPEVPAKTPSPGRMDRGQLLRRGGLGAVAAIAGLQALPTLVDAKQKTADKGKAVEGAWHATVHVDGSPTPFDTLYAFSPGGAFARVDGRNNGPSLGTWKVANGRIIIGFVVFSFGPTGLRNGTITAQAALTVSGDTLSGTFAAQGLDLSANPLPGFPKTGTFDGTRIIAMAP